MTRGLGRPSGYYERAIEARDDLSAGSDDGWWLRKASRLWPVLLTLAILYQGILLTDENLGVVKLPFKSDRPLLGGSDYPAFYGGARLIYENPVKAYDQQAQSRSILEAKDLGPAEDSTWFRYYNPPAYSVLLAPLTLLDVRMSYGITLLLNLAGLVVLLKVVAAICGGWNLRSGLIGLAVLCSAPLNYAFWHAQPTLFLAALTGLAYLGLENRRYRSAGASLALLGIKPHWVAFHLIAIGGQSRRVLPAFVGVSMLLLSAFLLVGVQGTVDYVRLLSGRGNGDVTDPGFAEAVLSWSGFFRGLTGEAQPGAWLAMSAVTLGLFAVAVLRGERSLLVVAATATTLLVVPHSHPQDWIALVPAAAFMVSRQQSAREAALTTMLLTFTYLTLNNWSGLPSREGIVYWPTLGAFALLSWATYLAAKPGQSEAEASATIGMRAAA